MLVIQQLESRDSLSMHSSDEATDWMIENWWFVFWYVLYQNIQNGSVTKPTPLHIQYIWSKNHCSVVKRPGREAEHSRPSIGGVENL